MAELYRITNGPAPTTASQVAVTTGTAIKTMLQVKLGTTALRGKVIEWGISFDSNATAQTIICELLTTDTVAATVTAHVAAGIQNLDPFGTTPTSGFPFTFSTSTTGYTASAEGSIASSRTLDVVQVPMPADIGNLFVKQWPLGREPWFSQLNFLRVRVKAAAAVNAICYVVVEV